MTAYFNFPFVQFYFLVRVEHKYLQNLSARELGRLASHCHLYGAAFFVAHSFAGQTKQ